MRLTKIYTRVGDRGMTMLASGEKRRKDDIRIRAYGDVDELNAHVGLLACNPEILSLPLGSLDASLLSRIQNELFNLGGELATPLGILDIEKQQVVRQPDIDRLETEMDGWNKNLPPLRNFVLPGSGPVNAQTHICRTVCRRAERLVVELSQSEEIRPECVIYLNRLSDWFFILSRHFSHLFCEPEHLWNQNKSAN